MTVVSVRAVLAVQTFQPFLRAETVIRSARFHELFGILAVYRRALALDIRSAAAVAVRPFVVIHTRRAQGAVDHLFRAFDLSFPVRILYAQDKPAAVMAREQIGVKPRAQIAYVHKSRGRGRETRPYRLFHFHLFQFPRMSPSSPLSANEKLSVPAYMMWSSSLTPMLSRTYASSRVSSTSSCDGLTLPPG